MDIMARLKLEVVNMSGFGTDAGGAVGRHGEARLDRARHRHGPEADLPGRAVLGLDPVVSSALDDLILRCARRWESRSWL
jgi:hypothetical protein